MPNLLRIALSFILLVLVTVSLAPAFAQSGLPASAQADLLQQDIDSALQHRDYRRIVRDIEQYRKLKVAFPPPLLFMEAVAASATGDDQKALAALTAYLKVANRSDKQYQKAISLYPKVKAAVVQQEVKKTVAEIASQMKLIPGGQFTMGTDYCMAGDAGTENGCGNNKRFYPGPDNWQAYPPHRVTLGSFYIQDQVVTADQFAVFAASTDRMPRTYDGYTFQDAEAFTHWLSKISGRNYRLPTEAEFEYAAHGGYYPALPWGSEGYRKDDGQVVTFIYHGGFAELTDAYETWPTNPYGVQFKGIGGASDIESEFTRDCWHPNYVGAPSDGSGWNANTCPTGVHSVRLDEPMFGFYFRYADGSVGSEGYAEEGEKIRYHHWFRLVLDNLSQ